MPFRPAGGNMRAVNVQREGESSMSKPMFFYAGVYESATDAEADLEAIKRLNDTKAIGSYDSAIVVKEADGNVRVTKTEKPVEHGAWIGAAAGAAVGRGTGRRRRARCPCSG